ncbi:MAG TPA: GxxExxY protein [Opitutaceae bacterium]|nr:GxxExxY protein [Opitutaceae bacterium]
MKNDIFILCDRVRQVSLALHKHLRHGHTEKVYENGLAHRLRKLGVEVTQQTALFVRDEDGIVLGDFIADMMIENCLIIEIKACRALAAEHVAQLLGYLRASGLEHGLLINFGSPKIEIRKYVLSKY